MYAERYATREDLDAAMRHGAGYPMGPLALLDLIGLDTAYEILETMYRESRNLMHAPNPVFKQMITAGLLGRKTGRGYYIYDDASPKGRPNPDVAAILDAVRAELGITPRMFSDDEIQTRYMAAMVNEGARILDEGIAARASDIDVVLLHGYGFPRALGGPMHWADARGAGRIAADIAALAAEDPYFWQPAPLLTRLAASGGRFADIGKDRS